MSENSKEWRRCNSCKKAVEFGRKYWICNVTTCTRKRTGYVFCSVSCWDAHVPVMNHRESWAVERTAPSEEIWKKVLAGEEEDPTFPSQTKPKEPEPPKAAQPAAASSGPKVILRRTPKN